MGLSAIVVGLRFRGLRCWIDGIGNLVDQADHEDSIVTRGVVIVEVLNSNDQNRAVMAVGLGASGEMTPWETIGLMKVVEIQCEYEIAVRLTQGEESDE